jgi:predicted N-acetyltransferase YhbS
LRHELERIWSIDRTETVHTVYRVERGELVSFPEFHDVRGWPPGEPEKYGPILQQCFARGGAFWGAFDGESLVGASVLDNRWLGPGKNLLQLEFLHVSRPSRGSGLGVRLFDTAVARARQLGARGLYVSATPSENTIHFYRRRGCVLAREVDPDLFALEPEDIHLTLDFTTHSKGETRR